ncbi:MAG: hypothetical protein PHO37_05420 [Kiritimatiellae bacterium]|nr:hypothetical protein [Kiritimatiellia bacterium]
MKNIDGAKEFAYECSAALRAWFEPQQSRWFDAALRAWFEPRQSR